MQETQIINAVQESAHIASREKAEAAVRATLRVLGQRLAGGETRDLAAQLPDGLAKELPGEGAGERFGLDDFYERVCEHEGGDTTVAQARQHARAVAAALKAGLSAGEFEQVATQLPADYEDLLQTEPVQHH